MKKDLLSGFSTKDDKATGDICHYGEENKQYYCHHKKGFKCMKCIDLIRGNKK